jgi:hypothetical protein
MAQTLELVKEILKDKYLPAFRNQIGIKPSPFLEMIKKTNATNDTVKAAATFGLNGGVGFGVDGSDTPISGPQMYKDFEIGLRNLYCNIEISDKTIKLGSKSESSMIDALDREVRSAFDATNWNLGRALFGDGSGVLCSINDSEGEVINANNVRLLKEGMMIDIYEAGWDAPGEHTPVRKAVRIKAIDRANKKVYVDKSIGNLAGGMITLQNSYNREITGLGAVMKATTGSVIYGKAVSENPWILPLEYDATKAVGGGLNDVLITNAMRDAERDKNGDIDLIMLGDTAFNAYQMYMKENNVTITEQLKFKGGHSGFEVLFGNKTAKVVNESFVPETEVWGVSTKDWKYESTPFDFANENSSTFTLVPGKNYYRALLTSYGNVICENPGASFKITNCTYSNSSN